ncbi:MAG TPA: cache domain-containing protein [Ramlibacter sp.]|nr:cache domain-containing protein [Ramlibacter sp.]
MRATPKTARLPRLLRRLTIATDQPQWHPRQDLTGIARIGGEGPQQGRASAPSGTSLRESRTRAMKSKLTTALTMALALAATSVFAAERVTPKEAEAMVRKGVAYIKANPLDKAMADITDPKGAFVDRELYLTVYKMDGTALAHGANARFVGKNMIELRDGNGKEHIRERLEMAKTKSTFWQDFTFVNPVNKKMEPKQMYCQRTEDLLVVCGGIYTPM